MLRKIAQSFLFALLLSLAPMPATAADAAPATEAAKGNPVALTADETKKLNIFFSNFSEAAVESFEAGKMTEDALINFGIQHNKINYPKGFQGEKLSSSEVDKACKKYFGNAPKTHYATKEYKYADGRYTVPASSGEAFVFSQVAEMTENANGTYQAKVNIFTASSGFTGDVHGTPASWKAAGDEVQLTAKMTAEVKKVTEDGKTRYLLLALSKAK